MITIIVIIVLAFALVNVDDVGIYKLILLTNVIEYGLSLFGSNIIFE